MRLLLIARVVIAVAVTGLCAVLVTAPTTGDAVHVVVTASCVAGGALLLLAQIAAAVAMRDPAVLRSLRTRRTALLAAFTAVVAVVAVHHSMQQPGPATTLFGLAAASLVLDVLGARKAHRQHPGPTSRARTDAADSATISQVFGSLLLVALAATIYQMISAAARPATSALQIGAGTLAVIVPFVLARPLRSLSRGGDAAMHERAMAQLWLATGAAAVAAGAAFVTVMAGVALAGGTVAMYRAVATVLVLLLAVLNCVSPAPAIRVGP